jgi:glycosyltransferase involved in cell wall biosynthesis
LCWAYQQADFIEQTLQGFLGQRTDFPFEVLVRDDASTDGTAEVIADFAVRYPTIIRPVFETQNQWSVTKGLTVLRPLARGSYIALCEGDDYWIDPGKIQRQVRTLTERPQDVVSHHEALVIEDGVVVKLGTLPESERRDRSARELRHAAWLSLATMCFRNVPLVEPEYKRNIANGDMFLIARLGEHGGAAYEEDLLPAVYRRHSGGVWSLQDPRLNAIRQAESYYWISVYFGERDDDDAAGAYLARSMAAISNSPIPNVGLKRSFPNALRLGGNITAHLVTRYVGERRPRVYEFMRRVQAGLRRLRRF